MRSLDPLRRFLPTPLVTMLAAMNRSIRLETNDARVLESAVAAFSAYPPSTQRAVDFVWRIVSQPSSAIATSWPVRSAFSGPGMRFVEFGQTNFIAVDLDAREAVGYLAAGLVEHNPGFVSPYLDNLFCLTAGALGFTPIFAGCVGREGAGILVAGPPNNGKTSACYLAAREGLEFHADRAVFLELDGGHLNAWGDFWPAAFRPDIAGYYPELQAKSRVFRYGDVAFWYLDKRPYQNQSVGPIAPVCCVFLERRPGGVTRMLVRLSRAEFSKRLDGLISFRDDVRYDTQRQDALRALESVPAYDLVCPDPGAAARVFPELLRQHPLRAR